MKTFKSITDAEQLLGHPLHDTIKNLVSTIINDYPEYVPEDDGYLVLIESNDVDRVLDDLDMPCRLFFLAMLPRPNSQGEAPVKPARVKLHC
jgi:hypothetical protein